MDSVASAEPTSPLQAKLHAGEGQGRRVGSRERTANASASFPSSPGAQAQGSLRGSRPSPAQSLAWWRLVGSAPAADLTLVCESVGLEIGSWSGRQAGHARRIGHGWATLPPRPRRPRVDALGGYFDCLAVDRAFAETRARPQNRAASIRLRAVRSLAEWAAPTSRRDRIGATPALASVRAGHHSYFDCLDGVSPPPRPPPPAYVPSVLHGVVSGPTGT